ncbi:MAG: addiction module protein [Pirellulales bacterium]|nr:addiction module protein [Pirellulales bacterium]
MEFALPLDQMTVVDKLRAIEVLWNDLSRNPEDVSSPPWHEDVLMERQRQIEEGRAKFIPLDEFRRSIQKEIQ